jgi:hypothetical protein
MCAPAAVIVPIVASVASVGLGIYSAVSGAQSAQAQADYSYQVQQQQAAFQAQEQQRQMDYQFAEAQRQQEYAFQEQQRQMEYRYQEDLRMAELNYQNQMQARDFEYQQNFLQYDYARQEQQRQYQYEMAVQQQNYEYQQAQVNMQRMFEQQKADQQASVMELNAQLAGTAYGNDLRLLDTRFMQEEEAAAQAKTKASNEMAQARAEIRASGRTGNTVDNLVADYYRQQASFDYATNRNLAFTGNNIQEQKRGAQATYAGRLASQQPYIQQPYVDAIKGQAYAPGAGVAPILGPNPIKQQVTRGTVTRGQVTKGAVVQAPVYQSYVDQTPYWIQGAQTTLAGVTNVVGAVDNYNYYKKTGKLPGRS